MDATDTLTRDDVATIEMAAFAVVAREGVARATLPAIAAEAGVAIGAVRAVYATEREVVRALLLRASAMDLAPVVDGVGGARDTLNLRDIARALIHTPPRRGAPTARWYSTSTSAPPRRYRRPRPSRCRRN